jgi:serine/threonine protein kinase
MQRTSRTPAPQPVDVRRSILSDVSETLPSLLREPPTEAVALPHSQSADCLTEDDILSFTAGSLDTRQVRRIDEHLGDCNTCSRLVTEMLGELAGPSATHPQFPLIPFVFAPATRVANRFAIQRLVGRGGMGEVYEALDLQRQRTVALKTVLAARSDSRQAMARLTLELHATRLIEHPHVCRAHDMGVHDDGAPGGLWLRFIVMEFIEGETLGQSVRNAGALPLPEARAIARQILLGLQAIHAAAVVHLDVKSDNVMLREGPGQPHAVLIDFGLARAIVQGTVLPRRVRSPAGTVSYMAPEQLLNQPVGPHTDVFGFGVVLFEILTGTHPFSDHPCSLAATRTLREAELPLRPSHVVSGISPELDDFVATCTTADPCHRFADATTALKHFDSLWL